MSAAAQAAAPEKPRRLGGAASTPMPHFVFRSLFRYSTYTEFRIFGLIADGTVSWQKQTKKWKCKWRSYTPEWLAEKMDVSVRFVEISLAELLSPEMGWIESRPGKRGATEYRITLIRNLPLEIDTIRAKCNTCGEIGVMDPDYGYCPTAHTFFRVLGRWVARAVLGVVGLIYDDTEGWNRIWSTISLEEFVLHTGLDRSVVQEALAEAERLGVIAIERSAGVENSYRLFTERFADLTAADFAEMGPREAKAARTAKSGEEKVETPECETDEKPEKTVLTRPADFVMKLIARCRNCGILDPVEPILDELGGDSAPIPPPVDGRARSAPRASPPAEVKKSKSDLFWEKAKATMEARYEDE